MNQDAYDKLLEFAAEEPEQEKTVEYLAQQMGAFVEPGERVLLCFQKRETGNLCDLMARAVTSCGARPVIWGEDRRWKTLLRLAFASRASTIIGTPLVVLGLSKLKKANDTPLFVHNVVTVGYPCAQWMLDGISKGFDCRTWGCFGLSLSGVVLGFSCGSNPGVHLRDDAYEFEIIGQNDQPLSLGEVGRWVINPKGHPELRYCPQEYGQLDLTPCPCGCGSPRLIGVHYTRMEDPELAELGKELLSWTSILDCSLRRGPYGLELELVRFPGEKLPQLPTCARLVVRPWHPDRDEPFMELPWRKNSSDFPESH